MKVEWKYNLLIIGSNTLIEKKIRRGPMDKNMDTLVQAKIVNKICK